MIGNVAPVYSLFPVSNRSAASTQWGVAAVLPLEPDASAPVVVRSNHSSARRRGEGTHHLRRHSTSLPSDFRFGRDAGLAWSLQLYLPPIDGSEIVWLMIVNWNYREKLVAVAAGRAAANLPLGPVLLRGCM